MALTDDSVMTKIVHGYFPMQALKKMNRETLEQCVVDLIIYSSDSKDMSQKGFLNLYEELCLNKIERPRWWPSDRTISRVLTQDGKYLMYLLRFLVYKCCVYFKKPSNGLKDEEDTLLPRRRSKSAIGRCWNESTDPTTPRCSLKRNVGTQYKPPLPDDESAPRIVIPLFDLAVKQNSLTQERFLDNFMLQRTSNQIVNNSPQLNSKSYNNCKFNNCTGIPFSSELGMELMKKEGHICPDITIMKSLEKRERYINRALPQCSDLTYPISFKKSRLINTYREYHFPKRQFHQRPGDITHQIEQLVCKPMSVLLHPTDLSLIQKKRKKKKRKKIFTRRKNAQKTSKNQLNISVTIRKPLHELKKRDMYVILNKV